MRKICYITGTRADFGLMQSTLDLINQGADFELMLLVTGMHLLEQYGNTVQDIEASGLRIAARIPVPASAYGSAMARNIATMIGKFVDALEHEKPDMVLLLGDRGEMLAGAIAAIHLNVPVVHIHGGERSGTVDEPVRHAISKLSHLHFTATEDARLRLIHMGERPEHVHTVGAPGLDGLRELATLSRESLLCDAGLDPARPFALLVHHPVLQEADHAGDATTAIIRAVRAKRLQIVALRPNSDAGNENIRAVLDNIDSPDVCVFTHFSRPRFVSWMAAADLMIGNSSAGIIEAATFGTPVVNIGSRQHLRERNANTTDVDASAPALDAAISAALSRGRIAPFNIYGDGHSGPRIVDLLRNAKLDAALLAKSNAY
ncbi:UDP-N-acetylglucosamine 2-epimerase [Herbaspirillum robiniae]|uniref:UDP-N-acetylglucosamine 2-epimerase n=1 Tax=Herbaspirillum robiniae TaxID=2014887 RepID=UPI003D785A56